MPLSFSVRGTATAFCLFHLISVSCFAAGATERASIEAPSAPTVMPPIALWPGVAPGEKGDIGAERDLSLTDMAGNKPDDRIIRLTDVSRPTITVYKPAQGRDTGAAVVVCPGGGYYVLAIDIEGTEVCSWLNSIGVTAVLLKYRVPVRKGQERYAAPLQDAQRAIGIVRSRAAAWGIDPHRIGILGFSAGGHLSATVSNTAQARTYPRVDGADTESCRPDFTMLVYPAYLTPDDGMGRLAPEIRVTANTPPAFIVQTEDDPIHVENAFTYGLALKNARVPVELHLYPTGGHGYGLRPSGSEVSHWPEQAAVWLSAQGWLKRNGSDRLAKTATAAAIH